MVAVKLSGRGALRNTYQKDAPKLLSRVDVRPGIHPSPIALLKDLRRAAIERLFLSLALHRDSYQRIEDSDIAEALDLRTRERQGHQFPLMIGKSLGSR